MAEKEQSHSIGKAAIFRGLWSSPCGEDILKIIWLLAMRAAKRHQINVISAIMGPRNVGVREGRSRATGLMANRRQADSDDWALDLQAVLSAVATRTTRV